MMFFGRLSWCFLAGSNGSFLLAGSHCVFLAGSLGAFFGRLIAAKDPPVRGVLPSAWVGNTINKLCSGSAGKKMNLFLH